MSDERLDSLTGSNYKITPELSFYGAKTRVESNESCLKQDKATHDRKTIVILYSVYEISKTYNISSYRTFKNCLFGAVSLISTNTLGMVLDLIEKVNLVLVLVDLVESNILVLGKDFVQGINGTTIYAKKEYSINFTENGAKFCLSLHYNVSNSYFLLTVQKNIYSK